MKIRSITYFLPLHWPHEEADLQAAGKFIAAARAAFTTAGYEVQTTRLATLPFPQLLRDLDSDAMLHAAVSLEKNVVNTGFDYLSLGPALPEYPQSYAVIPTVLARTENTFFSGMMTTPAAEVSLSAVRACAQVIEKTAAISPDGFANLRFAALANVNPGAPFFPAAYHQGAQPTFALATEAADLAVQAFTNANGLESAQLHLVELVESHAVSLCSAADQLAARFPEIFAGIDFTLAPFPLVELSTGAALERLGVPAVGLHGSLAAAAFLTDALDRASYPRAGFNGLMLPVLEDAVLAARAFEGVLSIKDLLLYSTVCGTGLDTIPIPGDTSAEQIAPLLLDLAALSLRLDKPLTARLMPIPGKELGDRTTFDFAYFANSRIMPLQSKPLEGLFTGDDVFKLARRSKG